MAYFGILLYVFLILHRLQKALPSSRYEGKVVYSRLYIIINHQVLNIAYPLRMFALMERNKH